MQTNRRTLLAGAAGIAAAGATPVGVAGPTADAVAGPIGTDFLELIQAHQHAETLREAANARFKETRIEQNRVASNMSCEAAADAEWAIMEHPCRNLQELRLKLDIAEEYGIIGDPAAEQLATLILADVRRLTGGKG